VGVLLFVCNDFPWRAHYYVAHENSTTLLAVMKTPFSRDCCFAVASNRRTVVNSTKSCVYSNTFEFWSPFSRLIEVEIFIALSLRAWHFSSCTCLRAFGEFGSLLRDCKTVFMIISDCQRSISEPEIPLLFLDARFPFFSLHFQFLLTLLSSFMFPTLKSF